MIQIELPCCDTVADLAEDAETVRCEACAIEHVLAPDARPTAVDETPRGAARAVALAIAA